jgi:hypothetical protein
LFWAQLRSKIIIMTRVSIIIFNRYAQSKDRKDIYFNNIWEPSKLKGINKQDRRNEIRSPMPGGRES